MKNKLFLALAISVLGALPCSAKDVKYDVKGTKAPKDGAKVYLINQVGKVRIDSAVVANGAFQMKGNAEEDALLAITVDGVKDQFQFFNDSKAVKLDVSDGTLSGSALNTRLTEYEKRNRKAYAEYHKIIEDFEALPPEEQQAKIDEWVPQYQEAIRQYATFYVSLIDENIDNLIPLAFVEHLPSVVAAANATATNGTCGWDKEKGEKKIEDLIAANPRLASHPVMVDLKARMAAADAHRKEMAEREKTIIGEKFKDYEGPDPKGNPHKLSEYVGQGKWVLVDFWASWCGPCQAEMPNVVAAYQKYHGKGLEIVGITFDREKEAWTSAITEWEMPWIHLYGMKDGRSVAADIYGVRGIPDNLLIDPEGTIVARSLRGEDLDNKLSTIFE